MENLCSIYVLVCPVDKEPRYVGKCSSKKGLKYRLLSHLSENSWFRTRIHHNAKHLWFEWLLNKQLKPVIKEVMQCAASEVNYWERFWIKIYENESNEIYNKVNINHWKYLNICKESLEKYPRDITGLKPAYYNPKSQLHSSL